MLRTLALFMAPIFFYLCAILYINPLSVFPYPQDPFSEIFVGFGVAISIIISTLLGCACLIYGLSLDDEDDE